MLKVVIKALHFEDHLDGAYGRFIPVGYEIAHNLNLSLVPVVCLDWPLEG
jgi:hypothetical protein